jgi:chemotaxis protein methyltransferase CheR
MSTATLPAEAISFVCTLVRQHSAIELDAAKAYLIESRLGPVAKKHGFATTSDLVRGLQVSPKPDLRASVVEAMTTNETSFYRDIHPFEALRQTVLPELLNVQAAKRSLNIWSAACSTGQEAYSIAMLIRDHSPEMNTWKLSILGTDLSDDVLAKARSARFSQIEMNRGLPAALLSKHFVREGLNWQLSPQIRGMVSFSKLNLIERWPPMPVMDIVFLRNVLIYFSPATKKAILEKIRANMAPHSVLFLGAAETTMTLDTEFARIQTGNYVYYRLK